MKVTFPIAGLLVAVVLVVWCVEVVDVVVVEIVDTVVVALAVDCVVDVLVEVLTLEDLEVDEEDVLLLLEDELVLVGLYVELLKVSWYWFMEVASWVPGLLNSPTANPISRVDPTTRVGKSYGEALLSAKGR